VTPGFLVARETAWSPDGSRIAFVGSSELRYASELWAMDPDGQHLRRIARGTEISYPSWFPDGRRRIFGTNARMSSAARLTVTSSKAWAEAIAYRLSARTTSWTEAQATTFCADGTARSAPAPAEKALTAIRRRAGPD